MISSIIEQIFERFRDEKDQGILTLTHIYLLVGCSSPIWLTFGSKLTQPLLLVSGVITVGIGDSFASIGGTYFGKHKWYKSNKSIEGTLSSFVSQMCAYIILNYYFNGTNAQLTNVELLAYTMISLSSSLYETFTKQIDNLMLPLFNYGSMILIISKLHLKAVN